MRATQLLPLLPVLMLSASVITVGVPTPAAAAEGAPVDDEALAEADESPLELGDLEVQGGRLDLSVEQEFSLRLVRSALGRSKSTRREDKDEWVCWFEKPTGTHFTHLACARNGDLWALEPGGSGSGLLGGEPGGDAGYGSILRTQRPVNRHKLEQVLGRLPGGARLDQEFMQRVLAGREPPQDLPSDDELARFAEAYEAIEALQRFEGASGRGYDADLETRMLEIIQDSGLSVDRYNRIVELVRRFVSLRDEVRQLMEE